MKAEAGQLPEGWQVKTVRQVSTAIQYGISEGARRDGKGPKLLRITDIQDGVVNWSTVPSSECSEDAVRRYGIRDGDIVFVRTGATTGKSFLIRNPPERSVFASYLIRVQCDVSQIQPEFLYAFFRSPRYWMHVGKSARGGTLAGLNATMLGKLPVPHPKDLSEQTAIADQLERKLSKVEFMRQAAGRQADALSLAEQALLREVFGRSGHSSWRKTSLGHLAEVVMGQSPDGSTYNREGKGLPLLNGPTEFGEDHPIPAQWTTKPRKTGKPDDILICVRGNTTGKMNRADQIYCLGRGIAAIRGRADKGATRFIRHAIRFKVAELLSGSERSTFPNIGKDDIEGFAVSAPQTLAEQSAMADRIEIKLRVLRTTSAAAARQREAIAALPGAILRDAFDFSED